LPDVYLVNASELRWMTPLFDRRRNSKSSLTCVAIPMMINEKQELIRKGKKGEGDQHRSHEQQQSKYVKDSILLHTSRQTYKFFR
jgi:hypothetical protein